MESRVDPQVDQARRLNNAGQLLGKLIDKTTLASKLNDTNRIFFRDRCLKALAKARTSTHYAEISEKLASGQTVLDDELLYYVVAIDDVSRLDENVFARLKAMEGNHRFNAWWMSTIAVLISAHEWQIEQDPVKKAERNDDLYHALRRRGSYKNYSVGFYLNMRGFNFSGADLTSTSLDCMDLENANFSAAILHNAHIMLSNISYANFNHTTAIRETNLKNFDQRMFNINGTIAKNASFDEANFSEPYFTDTDFSGSTFKDAKIEAATLKNVIFDDGDFSHCSLSTTCSYTENKFSMKNANLVDAVLHRFTLSDADLTGAKFLSGSAFLNTDNLNAELDKAYQLLKKFTDGGSDAYKESQNEYFKKIIAENVVAGTSGLPNDNPLKQVLIDAALSHTMFQPETAASRFFFSVSNGLYAATCTLFGKDNQQHIYHPTTALQILEEASEKIVPTKQRL